MSNFGFPVAGDTILARTEFSDEAAWQRLLEAVREPASDGFVAQLQIIDKAHLDGADAEDLARSLSNREHAILFVADRISMSHEDQPVLCADVFRPGQFFRLIPSEIWGADANLSLANLDFDDFAQSVGPDGIFRGF